MLSPLYSSKFFNNEMSKFFSISSIGTDKAITAATGQASILGTSILGTGIISETMENYTGNVLQNSPLFQSFDNTMQQISLSLTIKF